MGFTADDRDRMVRIETKVDTLNGSVKDHEARLRPLETFKNRVGAVGLILSAGITVLGSGMAWVFIKLKGG